MVSRLEVNFLSDNGFHFWTYPTPSRTHRFTVSPRLDCCLSNGDESTMRKLHLEAMDFDELWFLHEELTKLLAERISAEKLELEKRLAQLTRAGQIAETKIPWEKHRPQRRKYPKVLPKYSNPSAREETWSGRGKQPRWLVAALKSGYKLEDFLIANSEEVPGNKVRRSQ